MSSESKAGKDAAELAGLDNPTGIIATNDLDAILNDKPECAVYTAMADNRLPDELVEEATTTGSPACSSMASIPVSPTTAAARPGRHLPEHRADPLQEIINCHRMFDMMGFGKPLDDLPILLQPGVLSLAWGSEVRQLAAAGPGRRLVPG